MKARQDIQQCPQLNAETPFRDAVRFQNGVEVLLQRFAEGQRVRVLDFCSAEDREIVFQGQRPDV